MSKLDRYDLRILAELQHDARISNQELAAQDLGAITGRLKNKTGVNNLNVGVKPGTLALEVEGTAQDVALHAKIAGVAKVVPQAKRYLGQLQAGAPGAAVRHMLVAVFGC